MADWQRELDVAEQWKSAKDGKMSINQLAGAVSDKLAALRDFGIAEIDDEKHDLIVEFASMAADSETTADDFDELWDRLYDWADTSLDFIPVGGLRVCWIRTF